MLAICVLIVRMEESRLHFLHGMRYNPESSCYCNSPYLQENFIFYKYLFCFKYSSAMYLRPW